LLKLTTLAALAVATALAAARPAPIFIDYPIDNSIFPPEIAPPTFLFRDAEPKAVAWSIEVTFSGKSPAIRVNTPAEPLKIGEIDPRAIAPTNELPKLTPEQAAARTWIPDAATWTAIKQHSISRPAIVNIIGYSDLARKKQVSRGQVSIHTSADPAGAPIFFRDVPLMPNESDKGVIRPLPPDAIGLIKLRLRHIADTQSRTLIEGLPTCVNCHSFSLDGKTMGMDVDGPSNDKGLYALVPLRQQTSIRNENVIQWSSFKGKLGAKIRAASMSQVSPDGRFVVTTIDDPANQSIKGRDPLDDKFYGTNFKDYRFLQVFYPTRGILAWYSRETGMLQPLPGADDPRFVQTDGVWSPDGKWVVFARAEAKSPYPPSGKLAQYANDPLETEIRYELYRVPFNNGKGGTPERIEGASRNGMSNNFPKVSPDGKWIVFVRCRNGQLMRPDSQLFIVPFAGGSPRLMTCNTSLMNSWHSFSPNGRWMVFSSKSRSPYTQMFLTHINEDGTDSPPILIENATAANRAVNIPEFVNIPPDGLQKIEAPATDFFRVFDRALDLTKKNEAEAAEAEWRKAVSLNPEDGKARFNLALSLDQRGQMDEAITHYQKAVEVEPDNAAAFTNLAVALLRKGRLDDAIDRFAKSLAIEPDNAKAESNLGAALIQKGRVDDAIEHCRKALVIDPAHPDAHNSLGIGLAMRGKVDEAIPHLETAVAAVPDSLEYRYNLGRVLAAKRRFADAMPHFEEAVKLSNGAEPQSLGMLSAMYGELGRFADAAQVARRALDIAVKENDTRTVEGLRARIAAYEAKARQ